MSGTRVAVTLHVEWVEIRDAADRVPTLGCSVGCGGRRAEGSVSVSLRGVFSCLLSSPHSPRGYSPADKGGKGTRKAVCPVHPQGGQGDLESSENERGQGRRPKVLEGDRARDGAPGQLCDPAPRSGVWGHAGVLGRVDAASYPTGNQAEATAPKENLS